MGQAAGIVLEPMIVELFPPQVVTVVATEAMWSARLHPQEEACVAGATAKRRREFAAGRACARSALTRLGWPSAPLGRNEDRTPRWPAGVVGCISHCTGYCAAAVARQESVAGLGLDVEVIGRVRPVLLPRICSVAERDALLRLGRAPGQGAIDWATVLFCAKESTYKCYYPLTRVPLGFHDVEIELAPAQRAFTARLLRADAPSAAGARVFSGYYASDGKRVFSAVTLRPRPA
ncbi:MAG: 4'-phosphopantetheinyl transferase superfamily protein [Deltaproteobacteria bacterium]|nr:4'-phosphopantetheinyl transferase superfamily protein [Deltaproteobacteria bacterium]